MVRPIICVSFGKQRDLRLRWMVRPTPIAERWLTSLKRAIPHGINENDRIYNMPNQCWNQTTLCAELVSCMKNIEEFYENFFDVWPNPGMDHKTTNLMHVAFETLRGSIDQPSDLYINAPYGVQMEICRYNVLIHRWESMIMQGPPRFVCTFKEPFKEQLLDEDYRHFSIGHTYGAMVINYPQVGKQLLDVYRDGDDAVSSEAIRPMDRYGAGFSVRFLEVDQKQAFNTRFAFNGWFYKNHAYLSSLGFRLGDPKLAIGYIQVADMIEDRNRDEVLGMIGNTGYIDLVWIEE